MYYRTVPIAAGSFFTRHVIGVAMPSPSPMAVRECNSDTGEEDFQFCSLQGMGLL